jgi:hypothetical protein
MNPIEGPHGETAEVRGLRTRSNTQIEGDIERKAKRPVIRISTGHFAPEKYAEVKRLVTEAATALVPAIEPLKGLLYFHAAVDASTHTLVNVSVWETERDARQMDTLAPMLASRPTFQAAGVAFDAIANYEPTWKIEKQWSFGESRP